MKKSVLFGGLIIAGLIGAGLFLHKRNEGKEGKKGGCGCGCGGSTTTSNVQTATPTTTTTAIMATVPSTPTNLTSIDSQLVNATGNTRKKAFFPGQCHICKTPSGDVYFPAGGRCNFDGGDRCVTQL